jgi:molybdopterin-guanine dinucleotide biosynthesis protein A
LEDRVDVAFVSATDVPFLHPSFVRRMVRTCAEVAPSVDVVLPFARGHAQPLAAAYRTALAPLAAKLVATNRLRPAFLLDACAVLRLDEQALLADPELLTADPQLDSVVNVNDPADYALAVGRPAPLITVQCFGPAAPKQDRGRRTVRAATVGAAAEAAGVTWDQHVIATVNGEAAGGDGDLPLVPGDTVALLAAT